MYGNPAVLASPLEETGTKLFIGRPATLTALKEPPDPHNSIHRLTHVIILARLKEKKPNSDDKHGFHHTGKKNRYNHNPANSLRVQSL